MARSEQKKAMPRVASAGGTRINRISMKAPIEYARFQH